MTASRLFACRMTGYSSVTPLAPRIVRDVRAMSMAVRALAIFPALTCTGVSVPADFSRPRCSARSCAWYSDTAIHASLDWVSWNSAIALPNCVRVVAYDTAVSRQVRAAPVTTQTMPNLASVRHDSGRRQPHRVEYQLRRDGRAQRHFLVNVPRGEPAGTAWHEEPPDAVI